MNVTDRFDGTMVSAGLNAEVQAEIGATVLELLAAWYAQEQAPDLMDNTDPLLRAADHADQMLLDQLRQLMVEAVPRADLEINGQPRLPSRLGPVCRSCGCSQNDACAVGCFWVEPDFCSACRVPS